MEKLKTEETLAIECKGHATRDEVEGILKESGISIQNYNGHILKLLEDSEASASPALLSGPLSGGHPGRGKVRRQAAKAADSSLAECISRNIETFYGIDNCPSFLYSDRLLSPEQYSFFLEIYSGFYKLEYLPSDAVTHYVGEHMRTCALRIIESCDDDTTIDKLRKITEE